MEKTSPSEPATRLSKYGGSVMLCILHFIGWWFIYTFGFVLIGAVLGAMIFAVVGALTHPELELGYRVSKGVLDGAMYFGVWAGGLGMVLCARKAHKEGFLQ
mgnify:CR=1 FL=1